MDPRAGELRKSGIKIKLQEQPFQILLTLLSRPGDIVTRDELCKQLWSEDTFVDFDHSLNAAIKRLRDALGESAEAPVFIETLARRVSFDWVRAAVGKVDALIELVRRNIQKSIALDALAVDLRAVK